MHHARRSGMIAVWFLIALAVVLSPAPREWGYSNLQNYYEDHSGFIQPLAHFIVMCGFALIVSPVFGEKPLITAALLTCGASLLVATLLELLQILLPVSYARTCDFSDLWPSMAGGITGFLIWRAIHSLKESLRRSDMPDE